MASNDPKLLYAVEGINAYHLAHGREQSLTPSGPQTLSLLMVPTSLGLPDPSGGVSDQEEDFYLHLHLPPELDLPLPATTQIYHQPPTSYLIPRWDLGPDSGAFTRIEFPSIEARKGIQEDVDTFETILAQCTAFLERAPPPPRSRPAPEKYREATREVPREVPRETPRGAPLRASREPSSESLPAYNPAEYSPGQGYVQGSHSSHHGGRIVLVDEEDGSVLGELTDSYQVVEDKKIRPGSKEPVEITFPQEGGQNISVQPISHSYVEMEHHPAYKKSSIVSNATKASRLIVTTSDFVSRTMQNQANNFTKHTKPVAKPVTFNPTTHDRVRRINQFSDKAASLSSTTVGAIGHVAQNLGAGMARRKDGRARGFDKDGNAIETYKPGVLNKSLMAFNTVVDGIEQAGRTLLTGTSSSVTTVVEHRWGEEAGQVSKNLGGGFKNVGLVYIDVTGVSRRAILKSVAKGMVVGKVKGGGEIIVGGTESNPALVPRDTKGDSETQSTFSDNDPNGKRPAKGFYH